MNGIFPDYVGPNEGFQVAGLYPDWIYPDGIFEVIIEDEGGGGSSKKKKDQLDKLRSSAHGRKLLREDEEILAIVMVAMRTLQ